MLPHISAGILLLSLLVQRAYAAGPTIQSEYGMLSATCQKTLKAMIGSSNPIGSCSGIAQLVADLVAEGSESGSSMLGPLSQWESNFCRTSGCTDGVVKDGLGLINRDCSSDIKQRKYLALVIRSLLKNYDVVSKLACATAKDANQKRKDYCGRIVLSDLEKASIKTNGNSFTPSFVSAVAAQPLAFLDSLKGNAWCSECLNYLELKAAPVIDDVQEECSKNANALLSGKCGAKFNAKKAPKDVTNGSGKGKDGLPDYYNDGCSQAKPSDFRSLILILTLVMAAIMY